MTSDEVRNISVSTLKTLPAVNALMRRILMFKSYSNALIHSQNCIYPFKQASYKHVH